MMTRVSDGETNFTDEVPPPPNYEEWLNKPCWSINETSYLIQGINPDRPMFICEVPENESEKVDCNPAPINIKIEVLADKLQDLLKRAIKTKSLQSTPSDENYIKPHDAINYLKETSLLEGVILPTELLKVLKQKVKSKPISKRNQEWQTEMEIIAAEFLREGKKSQATKGRLSEKLAQETGENAATIERNTRKTW